MILFYKQGAMGSFFGGLLAEKGLDVVLVDVWAGARGGHQHQGPQDSRGGRGQICQGQYLFSFRHLNDNMYLSL